MTGPRVAVIGAGIIGCLVARQILQRFPDAQVQLLEQDAVASGASRRSAGLHFPRGSSEAVRQMSRYSQGFYARLRQADPDVPIFPLGMLVLASDRNAAQVRASYLDEAELTSVTSLPSALPDGGLTIPGGVSMWTVQGAQHADVAALTGALARDLRSRGSCREGTRVDRLASDGRQVTIGTGAGDTITVDRAVIASGPWLSAPAWRDLVAPLRARVKRVVALHLPGTATPEQPAIVFEDEDAFLLPLRHRGEWLFSYTCSDWDVEPDRMDPAVTAADLDQARAVLRRYAPGLAERTRSGRVFCDAYAPDRTPQVQTLDESRRVVFAGAANGSGYRLAPAIAQQTVDLLGL